MKKSFRYRKKKPKPPRKMSYRERQAGMYLVSTCFAAAFLALCVTVTSLAGCSIFPESSGQSQQSQSSLSTAPAADYNPETNAGAADPALNGNVPGIESDTAGQNYAGSGSYADDGTYTGGFAYTADGTYADGSAYTADGTYPDSSAYTTDGTFADGFAYTADGTYPDSSAYRAEGTYPDGTAYTAEGTYPDGTSYVGGPYADDGSYIEGAYAADGSYMADSAYAGDGAYTGEAYAADDSYIADGAYAGDGIGIEDSAIGSGAEYSDGSGNVFSQGAEETTASGPALTLPYNESDPAEMASAHNWVCSDLVENSKKLGSLSETEDFHAAVNREWLSSTSIPSGYVSYDAFSERQLEVDAELLEILESDETFSDPYIAHCQKLVRDYYKMWLDWDARDAVGMTPLAELLEPLQNVRNLEEMTEYLSDPMTTIEALPLCSSFTAANPNDTNSFAVYISPPSLTFKDAKYYAELEPDSWKTQPRYIYAAGYMLERLGYSKADRDTVLKQSYEFECRMADFMMTTAEYNSEDASARTNNPRTFEELVQEQGNFPLIGMLQGAGLADSNVFILQEPEWLAGMSSLYDEEHLEQMKSYLIVQDVLQFMDLLDHDCYRQMIKVRNILSGSSGQLDDKKAACDAVNSVLEMELGDVYAETYITEKTRSDVTELINDAINYYRVMLENEDFLSDSTKSEAVKKLDSLTIRVASPEERVSEFTLMDTGQTIISSGGSTGSGSSGDGSGRSRTQVIDFRGPEAGGSLIEARFAISRNVTLRMASEVNQPVNRDEWIAAPQEVNAYYYPLDNSINIPAGILGGNFYSDSMSREEKLGHIGIMIGHEISHAFDTSGRQYDETGKLRNWWTEDDYIRFHARAQKLVDYYNGFEPVTGYKVNGAMLDTEAIADLTGVKCMLKIAADESEFDYDLFFRTLASNWRCLTTLETEVYCIEQDAHPLAYLRTNAVVVQFDEFHQTYGTKEGDGMYLAPEYRLEVW